MANRLHLTFTISKNQEPSALLLVYWPQVKRKHPDPLASPGEWAGEDPPSEGPVIAGGCVVCPLQASISWYYQCLTTEQGAKPGLLQPLLSPSEGHGLL